MKTQDEAIVSRLVFSEMLFSYNDEKSHGQLHLVTKEVQDSAHWIYQQYIKVANSCHLNYRI